METTEDDPDGRSWLRFFKDFLIISLMDDSWSTYGLVTNRISCCLRNDPMGHASHDCSNDIFEESFTKTKSS